MSVSKEEDKYQESRPETEVLEKEPSVKGLESEKKEAPKPDLVEKPAEKELLKPEPVKPEIPTGEGKGGEKAPPVSAPSSLAGFDSDKIEEWLAVLKRMNKEDQIKTLCQLAFKKGLDFSINLAKALDNAYVLDKFHDSIVDELYKKLVETGQLESL